MYKINIFISKYKEKSHNETYQIIHVRDLGRTGGKRRDINFLVYMLVVLKFSLVECIPIMEPTHCSAEA